MQHACSLYILQSWWTEVVRAPKVSKVSMRATVAISTGGDQQTFFEDASLFWNMSRHARNTRNRVDQRSNKSNWKALKTLTSRKLLPEWNRYWQMEKTVKDCWHVLLRCVCVLLQLQCCMSFVCHPYALPHISLICWFVDLFFSWFLQVFLQVFLGISFFLLRKWLTWTRSTRWTRSNLLNGEWRNI